MINWLIENPRKLFLIDGLGAVLTASLLGLVYIFQSTFGMPGKIVLLLSGIAVSFCIFSFSCYFRIHENFRGYINFIARVNFLYCVISAGMVWYYYSSLTAYGVGYFVLEILVVLIIVGIEMMVAKGVEG